MPFPVAFLSPYSFIPSIHPPPTNSFVYIEMAEQYQEGHMFETLAEGKTVISEWMVRHGQTWKSYKTDKKRRCWIVICPAQEAEHCDFRIRIQEQKDGRGKLTVFNPHTCKPSTHNNNKKARNVKLLASNKHSITAVAADPKVAVKVLQANKKQSRGSKVPYHSERRAKDLIRYKEFGNETEAFQKIPGLLLAMQGNARGERGCYSELDTDPISKRFKRCWILPIATERAFRHCRNFVALDGTFCTGQYRMTLLVISTLDGNGQIIPIAWCLCCGENKKNWCWFLRGIKPFLLGMNEDDAVVISDRDKGLAGAVPKVFPHAAHGHCVFHIGQNVRNEYGTKLEALARSAAYSKTETSFKTCLKEIGKQKAEAQAYLENIEPNRWVLYAFPRPRYGQFTSNIQESVNKSWLPARDLPAVASTAWIWNYVMNQFFDRRGKRFRNNRLTDLATNWLEEEKQASARYRVRSSTFKRAVVEAPSGGQHIVNMDEHTCTCLEFQDNKLPCKHAIAVCKENNLEPENYVSIIYQLDEYRNTYANALPPIRIDDIPLNDTCLAPFLTRKKKGRNKKKRIRREELLHKTPKKTMHCSICRSTNHNKRTCDGSGLPPALNLQDSEKSSEETSDSAEESDSEEEGSSSKEGGDEDGGPFYEWNGFSDPIDPELVGGTSKGKKREDLSARKEVEAQAQTQLQQELQLITEQLASSTSSVFPSSPPQYPQPKQASTDEETDNESEEIDPLDEAARREAEEAAAEEDREDEEKDLRLALAEDPEEADMLEGLQEMDGYDSKHFGGLIVRHRLAKEVSPDRMAEEAWHKRLVCANRVWHRLTAEQRQIF